nr:uncharacterized protein LOC126537186 isoform X2 [Dermacentor andersoni]XP_054929764.1 uncharacterized protein LOC126537186 isoform X2 [Dermacentor andersoni]
MGHLLGPPQDTLVALRDTVKLGTLSEVDLEPIARLLVTHTRGITVKSTPAVARYAAPTPPVRRPRRACATGLREPEAHRRFHNGRPGNRCSAIQTSASQPPHQHRRKSSVETKPLRETRTETRGSVHSQALDHSIVVLFYHENRHRKALRGRLRLHASAGPSLQTRQAGLHRQLPVPGVDARAPDGRGSTALRRRCDDTRVTIASDTVAVLFLIMAN